MQKKTWRKWNNIIHRDLGYFFVGMSIIYGLSGIALNHMGDWSPSYIVTEKEFSYTLPTNQPTEAEIINWLKENKIDENYKKHYYPDDNELKVFLSGGSVEVDLISKQADLEILKRRPIFYHVNFLHYNPGDLWMWFSDLFCVSLIALAISGMFVLRGKNGLKRRGVWFVVTGILIPLALLFNYL